MEERMKLTYPAIFYKGDDDDTYAVEVPDLPGCVTEGDSLPEAIYMGADAASGWVLAELEEGREPPAASKLEDVHLGDGGFVSFLMLDMDEYTQKYGSRPVTKSLEIPAWLNTYVESRNIDISCVLRESLTRLYEEEIAP
jgi:predicted RNase H-like HicB family nuclease